MTPTELFAQALAGQPQLVAWRRHLHQNPEPSFQERATTAWISARLAELPGWRVERLPHETGLMAVLEPSAGARSPSPTVALRADIDALPIQEAEGLPYCSRVPGQAHLCGHDAHTAMGLGAAALLSRAVQNGRLPVRVKLIFQPAEETQPGGACAIVEAGLLDDVSAIAALHVYPELPTGTVGLRSGPLMAASDRFSITVHGRGGHGAGPEQCIDPIVVTAHAIGSMQHIISRNVDPIESAVLTVGQVQAGTAFNVIPGSAQFSGTLRSFRPGVRELLHRRLGEVVRGVCAAHGASVEVDLRVGYPPVVNDPGVVARLASVAGEILAHPQAPRRPDVAHGVVEPAPWCAGEDFAYYQRRCPGAMAFLGIGNPDPVVASTAPCHSPRFRIDESALPVGAALLAGFALGHAQECAPVTKLT